MPIPAEDSGGGQTALGWRLASAASSISAALLCVLVSVTPQGLFSDPAWQLKTVQQALTGESVFPNTFVSPDSNDLTRDVSGWISWWAPGPVFVVYPLMALGVPAATAVRIVAVFGLLLGALGWGLVVQQLKFRRWVGLAFLVALPWMRYASNNLFLFSAELFVFALMPFSFLVGNNLVRHFRRTGVASIRRALGLALILGAAYVLKYSSVLPAMGLVAAIACALVVFERWNGWRQALFSRRSVALAGLLVGFAVPILLVSLVNREMTGIMSLVYPSSSAGLTRHEALHAFIAPVLAAADLDAILRYVAMHPSRMWLSDEALLWWGVPGVVVAAWMLAAPSADDFHRLAATFAWASTTTLLLTIGLIAAVPISLEARHAATAGIMVMLVAVRAGFSGAARRSRAENLVISAVGIVYVALPMAYGPVSVAAKVFRTAGYTTGSSQLYNPLLAKKNVEKCLSDMMRSDLPQEHVWYLTSPVIAIDISGRALVVDADFLPSESLKVRHRTSRPLVIRALLPPHFETNEKGPIIRASFGEGLAWTRRQIDACNVDEWTAVMPRSLGFETASTASR